MSAEEKVFTIPELRLYILQYSINPIECFKCGYIPNKKWKEEWKKTRCNNKVYLCVWCDPYNYQSIDWAWWNKTHNLN